MQTHLSEQISIDAISTQAVISQSIQNIDESSGLLTTCNCLVENVEELIKVEQLITKELLQNNKAESDSTSIKLFTEKLAGAQCDNIEEQCTKVSHLLSHLPFVHVDDCGVASRVSLINPRSISMSFAEHGAAQCFLVISESSMTESDESQTKLTLKRVTDFVSSSLYGKNLRLLMSSIDSSGSSLEDNHSRDREGEQKTSTSPSLGQSGHH